LFFRSFRLCKPLISEGITNSESRIASYESRITNHEFRVTSHESRFAARKLRFTTQVLVALIVLVAIPLTHADPGVNDNPPPDQAPNYRVDVGDLLSIRVFGEPDLSIEARVKPGGIISYPFLGELQVAGLTTEEVDAAITQGLEGDYLIAPIVYVSVAEYRKFYVNGQVKTPGAYEFSPGLTIHKAISMAGGFTERAARAKIFVIRGKDASQESVRMRLEDEVGPGDIITVKQSFF
jgi:polysaccharide export outer membrane protein